jgi:hypothetical protein
MVGLIVKAMKMNTTAPKVVGTMNIYARQKNGASRKRGAVTELPNASMEKTRSYATVPWINLNAKLVDAFL